MLNALAYQIYHNDVETSNQQGNWRTRCASVSRQPQLSQFDAAQGSCGRHCAPSGAQQLYSRYSSIKRDVKRHAATLTITTPDDWHLHVRDGAAMRDVVPHTAKHFARAIIMPNLMPPVTTTDMVRSPAAHVVHPHSRLQPQVCTKIPQQRQDLFINARHKLQLDP